MDCVQTNIFSFILLIISYLQLKYNSGNTFFVNNNIHVAIVFLEFDPKGILVVI